METTTYTCPSCGLEYVSERSDLVACIGCGCAFYRCHECGALTNDPHTNSRNEDVCEACCDLCNHFVRCPECGWTGPESHADLNNFGERRCPECDCGNPLAEVTP